MERLYVTFYLLAIAMFAPSLTISEIFTVDMCMTLTPTVRIGLGQILTLTFRMGQGQM